MPRTNAISSTNKFIESFSNPIQFQHILQTIASPAPTQSEVNSYLRAVLTAKPGLYVDAAGIVLFGITVPFKALFKETLQALEHILEFQRNRRTLFNEVITQTYSIRYFNFSLNTQIDAVVPRDKLVAAILQHFQTLNKSETRAFIMQLRSENASNYSLLKHFDILLN